MDMKTHQCDICDKRFSNKGILKTHLKVHKDDKPFECDLCKKGFITKHERYFHLQTHETDEKPFSCHKCKKRFTVEQNLYLHLSFGTFYRADENALPTAITISCVNEDGSTNHQGNPEEKKASLRCDICSITFVYETSLKVHLESEGHLKNYTRTESHKCTRCFENFTSEEILKKHRLEAHFCIVCAKTFECESDLKEHKREHSDPNSLKKPQVPTFRHYTPPPIQVRKHECTICHKKFSKKYDLKIHGKTHKRIIQYEVVLSVSSTNDLQPQRATQTKPDETIIVKSELLIEDDEDSRRAIYKIDDECYKHKIGCTGEQALRKEGNFLKIKKEEDNETLVTVSPELNPRIKPHEIIVSPNANLQFEFENENDEDEVPGY